jgi:hypothetical protein
MIDTMEGILEDIDFDLDVKFFLDSWVGSAFNEKLG